MCRRCTPQRPANPVLLGTIATLCWALLTGFFCPPQTLPTKVWPERGLQAKALVCTTQIPQKGHVSGTWHGAYEERDAKTGALLESGSYHFGKRHGPWRTWHGNGQIATVANWDCGALWGEARGYHRNGELQELGSWVRGAKHGRWRRWYPTGQLFEDVGYRRGKRHGLQLMWVEDSRNYNADVACWQSPGGILSHVARYADGVVLDSVGLPFTDAIYGDNRRRCKDLIEDTSGQTARPTATTMPPPITPPARCVAQLTARPPAASSRPASSAKPGRPRAP